MENIVTSGGFVCTVDPETIEDVSFFLAIRRIKNGDPLALFDVAEIVLGTDQAERLIEHIRNESGKAPVSRFESELTEIIRRLKELKK